jgi:hypothetical protein
VLLGGKFGPAFDVYREVQWDKDAHRRSTLQDDYFDVVRVDHQPIDIDTIPDDCFELGLDWKESHLLKARRLQVHQKLILCNPNHGLAVIPSSSMVTIWAPNLYWNENLTTVLHEFRRILRQDGRVITIAPDVAQLNHMLYRFAGQIDPDWLRDLDRGRYQNVSKQARSFAQWEAVMADCGLQISSHSMFIPALVGQVYDVGFRPMFSVFMNMYEKLQEHSPADLLALKQHWIETTYHFLAPFCDLEWMQTANMENLWHIFELRPKPAGV